MRLHNCNSSGSNNCMQLQLQVQQRAKNNSTFQTVGGRGNSFSAGIANNTVWQSLQLTRPPATGQETHNIL